DQPLGVLGSGPRSVHQATLVRQLSPDVVFFRHTLGELSAEEAARLGARDIEIVDGAVTRLLIDGDQLAGVQLADGTVHMRSAVFVTPRLVANDEIIAALGAATESTPVGTWIKTDPSG